MSGSTRSMRTPLGRVRAHGASGEGTGHFIAVRVTSIALAVLAVWFVISVGLAMPVANYQSAIDYLTLPVNAVGVLLLVLTSLYHMHLGMQEVILDYVHKPVGKAVLLLLNTFVPVILGAGAIFAVLMINFGA